MHTLLKKLFNKKDEVETQERKVIKLSDRLLKALGTDEVPEMNDDFIDCGKYIIIQQTRLLCGNWVDVLEISIPECYQPGYSQIIADGLAKNDPPWLKIPNGTRTVNLPPDEVIEEVLSYLQNNK